MAEAEEIGQRDQFPLISVIIPVHNGEKYFAECLDSIAAQDYPDMELIIIDDGSHFYQDQLDTFKLLKSKVKKGGLFIIEDVNDLNIMRTEFEELYDGEIEIIDNREIKNRQDDVLIVYKF